MINYEINLSTQKDIQKHLEDCSNSFIPPLNTYVNIQKYSKKIFTKSIRFESWYKNELIGLLAIYSNTSFNKAFLTNLSLNNKYENKGIGHKLVRNCKSYLISKQMNNIDLEVNIQNHKAIKFYKKNNFVIKKIINNNYLMSINIKRDYNKEIKDAKDHKYAYNFDFDVMHPFMLKSFIPFFNKGNLLELGSFKGDFTKRFLPYFDDITCIEASYEAVKIARKEFDKKSINIINDVFEKVKLTHKYDNIILTHVLEHIEDPIKVLKRANDEWLSEKGRFFIVCPNANAPSRQIAVKMGLISHNSAITPAEKEHGHHITYSLDTLERDIKKSGLNVIHRSGIFFKALANFQWDRLLETDIISKEYLEGCFQLGQQYPDLCSSIFFVCEKGNK
tara:strand:- start:1891 stop:3063 length:1173 start_codon:yes stop_codon:yes gene_type:complete